MYLLNVDASAGLAWDDAWSRAISSSHRAENGHNAKGLRQRIVVYTTPMTVTGHADTSIAHASAFVTLL